MLDRRVLRGADGESVMRYGRSLLHGRAGSVGLRGRLRFGTRRWTGGWSSLDLELGVDHRQAGVAIDTVLYQQRVCKICSEIVTQLGGGNEQQLPEAVAQLCVRVRGKDLCVKNNVRVSLKYSYYWHNIATLLLIRRDQNRWRLIGEKR